LPSRLRSPAVENFTVEHYANFGTREPWVARIGLGLQDLVFVVPAFASARDEFMDRLVGKVFESLGQAFEALRTLRKQTAEGAAAIDVTSSYESLYGSLWRAYKDRFQSAMEALNLDIGFLFTKPATFEKVAARLVADRPELEDLIGLMRRDRADFQSALAAYRNLHLEHRRDRPELVASFHRLDSAEAMFENVWVAIEDYVVLYVIANLPPALRVVEIPEDERDPSVPKRFRLALAHPPPTASE
jgi:hypothetical protein